MKTRVMGLVMIAGLSAAWPAGALGGVIVSLNNPGSTTLHELWVEPGEVFEIDLNVETDISLSQLTLGLQASQAGTFDVAAFADATPWSSLGQNNMIGGIDPESGTVTTTVPVPIYVDPGFANVGTIGFIADPGALLGTYTLGAARVQFRSLRTIPEDGIGTAGPDLLVHVIPEPASIAMVMCLGLFWSLRRA